VRADVPDVDCAADHRSERGVRPGLSLFFISLSEEPFVGQVADARGEAEAQQVHQSEHMVREAGRVGVVFFDPQIGFMVEQAVEDVGGIAHRGVDDFGVEGRVLVGDVGVELHAWLRAVPQVYLPGGLSSAAGPEVLPVQGRRGAVSPVGGERLAELRVGQSGQPSRVGLVADVPRLQPGQPRVSGARTGFRHLAQAQVDRVGQNGRQQQLPVFGPLAALEVPEVPGEAGPVVHLQKQFGDLQVRQQAGRLVGQRLRLVGDGTVKRRDLEAAAAGDGRIGQFAHGGEPFHGRHLTVQQGQPVLQEALTVGLDSQAEFLLSQLFLRALRREARCRNEVLFKILELARPLDPDVPRAQRVLEFGQHAQLVEAPVQPVRRMHQIFPAPAHE